MTFEWKLNFQQWKTVVSITFQTNKKKQRNGQSKSHCSAKNDKATTKYMKHSLTKKNKKIHQSQPKTLKKCLKTEKKKKKRINHHNIFCTKMRKKKNFNIHFERWQNDDRISQSTHIHWFPIDVYKKKRGEDKNITSCKAQVGRITYNNRQ